MALYDFKRKLIIPESVNNDDPEQIVKYAKMHKSIMSSGLVKPRIIQDMDYRKRDSVPITGYVRVLGFEFNTKYSEQLEKSIPFAVVLGYSLYPKTHRHNYMFDTTLPGIVCPYAYIVYIPEIFWNRVSRYHYSGGMDNSYPRVLHAVAFDEESPEINPKDIELALGMRGLKKPERLIRNRRSVGVTANRYIQGLNKFTNIARLPGAWPSKNCN